MKVMGQKLKIGELSQAAGVPVPTIKYYLQQGLINQAQKTGRTMAWYDRGTVDRIKLIKRLQRERFLPLEVIKRVIDSGRELGPELALGQAMFKTGGPGPERRVPASGIEKAAGWPLCKIRRLEKERLLTPTFEHGERYYDDGDLEIIAMFKFRESLGLPMDFSLGTVTAYRDAVREAVQKDVRLFADRLLGDVSTRQAIKLMTEADETLDRFMHIYRRKVLREFSRFALEQVAGFSKRLRGLSFLPIAGRCLPGRPPADSLEREIFFFLSGDFTAAANLARAEKRRPWSAAAQIFAALLSGQFEAALEMAETKIPAKSSRPFDHLAAGLASFFAIDRESGLSRPAYLLKQGLARLRQIDLEVGQGPGQICYQYLAGTVYTILPELFNRLDLGVSILERADQSLHRGVSTKGLPRWLSDSLERELLPALQLKLRKSLAEAKKHQHPGREGK
jgi:DNA-binding transcriptional MerR regulator